MTEAVATCCSASRIGEDRPRHLSRRTSTHNVWPLARRPTENQYKTSTPPSIDQSWRQILGRKETSCRSRQSRALSLCRVLKSGENILLFQIRKIREDFLVCHAGGQVAENVIYGDSHASNARLSTTLSRLNRNSIGVRHGSAV